MGWVGGCSAPRPSRFIPKKNPVPTVHEAGWVPRPVWTGAENLAPTGIRSPDCPARSESLYGLSCPDPHLELFTIFHNFKIFSQRFFAESLKTMCGTLGVERCLFQHCVRHLSQRFGYRRSRDISRKRLDLLWSVMDKRELFSKGSSDRSVKLNPYLHIQLGLRIRCSRPIPPLPHTYS